MTDIEKRAWLIVQVLTKKGKMTTSEIRNELVRYYYTTSQIRNALKRLQRDEQVKINEAWSSGTRTTWELVK